VPRGQGAALRGSGWPHVGARDGSAQGPRRSRAGAPGGCAAGAGEAAPPGAEPRDRGRPGRRGPRGPGPRGAEERGGVPRAMEAAPPGRVRGGGGGKRGYAQEREGEEEEEREGEGKRAHLGDPNPAITVTKSHRAQQGRERGEREGEEVAVWEKSNERDREEGGAHGGGGGAPGARGPRPGRAAGRNPTARTTIDRNSNRGSKSETRRGEDAIKHDIRQKKYASA
jgi:hypothetical protein